HGVDTAGEPDATPRTCAKCGGFYRNPIEPRRWLRLWNAARRHASERNPAPRMAVVGVMRTRRSVRGRDCQSLRGFQAVFVHWDVEVAYNMRLPVLCRGRRPRNDW